MANQFICAALKMIPALVNHMNIMLTWVLVVDKDLVTKDVTLAHNALAHHKSILASIDHSFVPVIADLDIMSDHLGNKSLHQIILDLHLPSDKSCKAFLMAEMACNSEAILHCTKKWEEEACMIIEHLLLFLRHKHPNAGDAVEKGFQWEAIEEAEDFDWDDKTDLPISKFAK